MKFFYYNETSIHRFHPRSWKRKADEGKIIDVGGLYKIGCVQEPRTLNNGSRKIIHAGILDQDRLHCIQFLRTLLFQLFSA
jgi:hypothetical protein